MAIMIEGVAFNREFIEKVLTKLEARIALHGAGIDNLTDIEIFAAHIVQAANLRGKISERFNPLLSAMETANQKAKSVEIIKTKCSICDRDIDATKSNPEPKCLRCERDD